MSGRTAAKSFIDGLTTPHYQRRKPSRKSSQESHLAPLAHSGTIQLLKKLILLVHLSSVGRH
jgi:hypothetical protein